VQLVAYDPTWRLMVQCGCALTSPSNLKYVSLNTKPRLSNPELIRKPTEEAALHFVGVIDM